MQQQYGANLDRRAAVSLGLLNQALEAAVARRLVDAHARDLDLTVADDTVAARIRQNPIVPGQQAGSSASGSTCSCAASA